MKSKPKLSQNQLIDEKFRGKGITTNNHTDEEIIDILENRNYYYRLASYRKNYSKNEQNKYIGLDFEALTDMASVDTYLREYILSLTLDVEHNAKTDLMKYITNDPNEDGYFILNEFKADKPENQSFYDKTISKLGINIYLKDMYKKRGNRIAVWVFFELVDFGTFNKFVNFYHHKLHNNKSYNQTVRTYDRTLKFVKNLRNATAHNNIFLINVFDHTAALNSNISEVKTFARKIGINETQSKFAKINDLICLFSLHKQFASDNLNNRRYQDGKVVIERMHANIGLHKSSEDYQRFLQTINKLVEFLR